MTYKAKLIHLAQKLGYDIYRRNAHPWGEAQIWLDLRRLLAASRAQGGGPLVCYDVGAFRGDTIKQIAGLARFDAIHGFEPFPESFAALERRFANTPGVHLNNLAVSDTRGTTQLHLTRSSQSNSILPPVSETAIANDAHDEIGQITVETTTLDMSAAALDIERIALLKLDVQGAELSVLKGATRLLAEGRIDIVLCEVEFIELYEQQPLFWDIAAFATEHGLDFYGVYAPRPDKYGRMAWADAIFCRRQILDVL